MSYNDTLLYCGDKIRELFNIIQGQLSSESVNGYPFNCVKIIFYNTNPTFRLLAECVFPQLDISFCKLELAYMEHDNKPIVDFKKAGARLKKEVQEVNKNIKAGNFTYDEQQNILIEGKIALFPDEYYFEKIKEYDCEVDKSITENTESLNDIIKFRKSLKKYITEDLNIDIVPSIWKGADDTTGDNFKPKVTIRLKDCKERFYEKLLHWKNEAFKNVLLNFYVPTRIEISQQSSGYSHKVNDVCFDIE